MLAQACTGGDSHCASLEEPSDHIVRFVESFQVCVPSHCCCCAFLNAKSVMAKLTLAFVGFDIILGLMCHITGMAAASWCEQSACPQEQAIIP